MICFKKRLSVSPFWGNRQHIFVIIKTNLTRYLINASNTGNSSILILQIGNLLSIKWNANNFSEL